MNETERTKEKYKDIIGLPHHTSTVHMPMSMIDRAAQFAPFAALNGFEDDVDETAANHKVNGESEYVVDEE